MGVFEAEIVGALRDLDLAGQPICVHASLRSFGWIPGGAPAVVGAFLHAGCTLLVPTFTWRYAVEPRPEEQLSRNAWPPEGYPAIAEGRYTPETAEVDRDMGALAAAVAQWPGCARGLHPLCSFSAVGPLAHALVDAQTPEDVYAPLRHLTQEAGSVILAGVGLEKLTLLHLAEALAGRELFRRWAVGAEGKVVRVAVGGCSAGFARLEPVLAPLMRRTRVGESAWTVLPAAATLERAAAAIRADPDVTRCADAGCERCRDAVAGGPILRTRVESVP